MRRSISIAVAAAFGLAGAAVSFAPAQAGVMAPSVAIAAKADTGIVKVHRYKKRGKWYGHSRKRGRHAHVILVPAYPVYPAYPRYSYGHGYGYGGPSVSFSLNFGGDTSIAAVTAATAAGNS